MILVLAETVVDWPAGFEAFCGRFAGRFPRVESRRQMRFYLRGLLSEAERKNGWTLAESWLPVSLPNPRRQYRSGTPGDTAELGE